MRDGPRAFPRCGGARPHGRAARGSMLNCSAPAGDVPSGEAMTNPLPNVTLELLQDLVAIGYLIQAETNNHAKVTRAITRFQRHAQRSHRMPQPDAGGTFSHAIDGICDAA